MALISGGKDSCHAMYLAQQHGHEIVALANLLPKPLGSDDLNSYMYQTVSYSHRCRQQSGGRSQVHVNVATDSVP